MEYGLKCLRQRNLSAGMFLFAIVFISNFCSSLLSFADNTVQSFEVVVLGGGPAGLAAGMHLADAHVRSVVLTGPEPGGLLTHAAKVENWPGIIAESGLVIMQRVIDQAAKHGVTLIYDSAVAVNVTQRPFVIQTAFSGVFTAHSLIVALGSSPRKLQVPGEAKYWGHGVSSCALCDAFAYVGKKVVVIGGGDSAVDQALHLADYAEAVTVFVRSRNMRAKPVRIRELLKKVTTVHNKQILEIIGNGQQVIGIRIKDRITGFEEIFPTDGVFLAIGHEPNTWLFKDSMQLSPDGHILVDFDSMQTSIPGVFAAGDVVAGSYRQVPVAIGDAIKAAGKAIDFIRYRDA